VISKKQRTEWTENPVTLALKALCEEEFKAIRNAPISDNLVRGEPELTQENLIENACRELEWAIFLDFLEGDWSELELEDDDSDEAEPG
jgi:hypothetical protein